MNDESFLKLIAQTIYEKKGKNTLTLDIHEISSLTDYLVIAEGNVDRHVKAVGQAVVQACREAGIAPVHVEGREAGDWVVIDFSNVVVHLFMPGLRDKYSLEKLWGEGSIVDVPVDVAVSQ
jgi:ribosome-associated protein